MDMILTSGVSPTCTGLGVAGLEGHLCLAAAVAHAAGPALYPPSPGPGAGPARGRAPAPAAPGRPLTGVPGERGAEVPVSSDTGIDETRVSQQSDTCTRYLFVSCV